MPSASPARQGKLVLALTAMFAFALNHSARAAGFNLSAADGILVLLLILLIAGHKLFALRYSVIFFAVLLGVTLSTTLWLTPAIFGVSPSATAVVADLVKLLISFLYFVVGTSIARLGIHHTALKWFAVGALCVALLGTVMEATGFRVLEESLYYAGIRYRGFMADPNFYAVLSCAGLAYFAYFPRERRVLRVLASVILASSVFLSGSKTGMIVLVVLLVLIVFDKATSSRKFGAAALFTIGAALFIAFMNPILSWLAQISTGLSEGVPQLRRMTALLTESPLDAIAGDGSSRDAMWSVGLQIIEQSPFFGVGIGTYNSVSMHNYGQRGVAHNTYIQLFAEWGFILAILLFAWIAVLILRALTTARRHGGSTEMVILSNIVIAFLIGSVALSLNNARMFWFFLGILAYLCTQKTLENRQRLRVAQYA